VEFDFRAPDYGAEMARRMERLRRLRENPEGWHILRAYYREHPVQLIDDWGVTYDPRNVERGMPAFIPFRLFPRQFEFCEWVLERWAASEAGLCDKSRDMGVSWLAITLSCTLCLTRDGVAVGFGSRKEEYVDKLDSPKSLFYKARVFLRYLPVELRAGWIEAKHAPYMRIILPQTNGVITGEAGDNIGRGDRTSIYFVDESAHLERPELVEASLSATTNCRIDVSSVNGMANPFAVKRHSWPERRIFTFHWRSDPRKDDAWYARMVEQIQDATVIAQEIDISYTASVTGVVIPSEWVQSAIGALEKLGLAASGARQGGLDVADEGPDLNAFAGRHGVLLDFCEAWAGKGDDIFGTTQKAFDICAAQGYASFRYDGDGLGAGVRGDARVIAEGMEGKAPTVTPYRGSAAPVDPDGKIPTVDGEPDKLERTNGDYFANAKAQAWWSLRMRFLRTHRAVTQGVMPADPDELISISPHLPDLQKLKLELSQATYSKTGAGKLLIDKSPNGARSPNRADAVVIAFAPVEPERRGFFDL